MGAYGQGLVCFVALSLVLGQVDNDRPQVGTCTIHVRDVVDPERVLIRSTAMEAATVLDAVASITIEAKKLNHMAMWVVRPIKGRDPVILPIDWLGMTRNGQMETNFQLFPGDRLYVQAQPPEKTPPSTNRRW